MSEKINEIVNREVTKELEKVRNDPSYNPHQQNDGDDLNDSDEFLIQTTDVLAVTQSMVKDLKNYNQEFVEDNECNAFSQYNQIVKNKGEQNSGFEMTISLENSKVMFHFEQVTERAAALYQKIYDLVDSEEHEHSQVSHSLKLENSNRSSQVDRNDRSESMGKNPLAPSSLVNQNHQPKNEGISKIYERKLPPNVEEMLRQKREQLASQLSYQ